MKNDWDSVWSRKGLLSKIVDFGRNLYNVFFVAVLRAHSDKNTMMAEIGCGTSTASLKIAKKIMVFAGLDISAEALRISKENANNEKAENAFFVRGNCFRLPFRDCTFDLVWSQGLIEHFNEPEKIVNEHLRVCKKSGTVLISVPYKYSYTLLWWYLTRPKLMRFLWPWTDQDFYTENKFTELAAKVGIKKYEFILNLLLGVIILKTVKD
jgi:ubiquinone/menaquinone biosynthesis C-methylase UbiE